MIRILAGRPALLAGAVALAVSFPSPALFPLAWVCLLPLLLNLLEGRGPAFVAKRHFLFFVPAFGLLLYWIPAVMTEYGGLGWPVALAIFALLAVVMSALMFPFSLLTWLIARSRSPGAALLAAPALWTLCELFRGHFVVGGFPWGTLGYSQHPFSALVQVADLGGVYFLSFLVVAGNAALLLWSVLRRRALSLAFGALIVLSLGYGVARLQLSDFTGGPARMAALVQPGIQVRGTATYFEKIYTAQLPALYAESCRAGADWVFFPEAPNPYPPQEDPVFQEHWRKLVAGWGRPLALNGTGRAGSGRSFNSVFVFAEDGRLSYRYDKRRLVPFGEYLPAGSRWLGLSSSMVQGVGSYSPGSPHPDPAEIGDECLGFLICYESIFPALSRDSVVAGARFLVNLTNDLWFGDTAAPRQHLQMAALRAVELRRPLLRVANAGISAHIDAYGRIRERLELFETGSLVVRFAPSSYPSHFARFGQGSVGFIIMMTLLGAGTEARRFRRKGTNSGKLS